MTLDDVAYAFSLYGPQEVRQGKQTYRRMDGLTRVVVDWWHDGGLNSRTAEMVAFEPLAGTVTFHKCDTRRRWTVEVQDLISIKPW